MTPTTPVSPAPAAPSAPDRPAFGRPKPERHPLYELTKPGIASRFSPAITSAPSGRPRSGPTATILSFSIRIEARSKSPIVSSMLTTAASRIRVLDIGPP